MIIRESRLPCKVENVPLDGNCFFHAVARGLLRERVDSFFNKYPSLLDNYPFLLKNFPFAKKETVSAYFERIRDNDIYADGPIIINKLESRFSEHLRLIAVAYLRDNPFILQDYPPENETIETYLNRMMLNGVYAEGSIIEALAKTLDVWFCIVEVGEGINVFCRNEGQGRRIIGLVRYARSIHYNALVITDEHDIARLKAIHSPAHVPSPKLRQVGIALMSMGAITLLSFLLLPIIPVFAGFFVALLSLTGLYCMAAGGVVSGIVLTAVGATLFAKNKPNEVSAKEFSLINTP